MRFFRAASALVIGAAMFGAPAASAQDAEVDEAAALFGARETVLDIALSPSGNKIAYVSAGPQHSEVVNVIDLAGDATIRQVAGNSEKIADIDWCEWATETRLVCQVSGMARAPDGTLLGFDRLFAISDDGSNAQELSQRQSFRAMGFVQRGGDVVALDVGGEQGQILMARQLVKEVSVGTRLANEEEGLGVDLVDVENGRRRTRERADPGAQRFIADEVGRVRLKVRARSDGRGFLTGEYDYAYRAKDSNGWQLLKDLTIGGREVPWFSPVAVDSARDVAIGFISIGGYDAIAEFTLDGSGTGRVLMARADVDVDALIRIGRQRRVVGASYATEKRTVAYFNPELAKLAEGLARALPDQPMINIVGASADETKLLLIASSDTQPGMVYLFDKAKRSLEPILPVRANLAERTMGTMQPVTYPAADGTEIPAYLTLPPGSDGKNLAAIVMPHGGPAARDEWGFDWLVQYFIARGYAVLQPNYRGSAGYGDAWYGRNGYQSWDVAIGDVNDAGRWLVSQGIADPERLAIAGWSYGGYAALQSQVLDPSLFKAVAAIAPVTDLEFLREDARAYTSFKFRDRQLGQGPHIAAGSPRRHAEKFVAPVALFHGTRDLNVDVRHAQAMEKALKEAGKQVIYHEYEDLQHGLGDSAARADMLATIGRFFDEALGRGG